jgi:tubulin--tyrosine ligase
LTNDAVQKQLPDYGKFEKGNKISYEELNDYIKKSDPDFDFQAIILTKMKVFD